MKIAKTIFRHEALGDQQCRVGSKKSVQSCPELVEGKAAAFFARGMYWRDVSTEKWRERRWRLFSTDPPKILPRHPHLVGKKFTKSLMIFLCLPINVNSIAY